MPEGPECKILANLLNKKLSGKKLINIEIYKGRYKNHGPPKNLHKLLEQLPLTIDKVQAYGKFIWYEFKNSDLTLWNTLGMSGWYQEEPDKHNNVGLFYDKDRVIYFNDYRNFGTFMVDTKDNLEKKIKSLGLDILDKKDNTDEFIKLVRKSRKPICEILLNQKIVSGSGNYLRADSLFLSKINPFLTQKDLTDEQLKDLFDNLRQLAWFHYNVKEGKKIKIITNKINFDLITDRIFFVYAQKTDVNGKKILRKKINTRSIYYSETQVS